MAAEAKNQLSVQLGESSGMFARSALQAQHTDDRVYLLHAATALEHLAKAVLAARHPSLIVPANDFDSLLHACGEAAAPNRPRKRMKTIGARDAVARAGHFVPAVLPLTSELELLIDVRNGVAHLGEVQSEDADRVLVPYLQASEALRETVGIDRGAYWGEFTDVVDSALKENVEKARVRVETALAIARTEFARRFDSLDDATKTAMLGLVEAGYRPEKYDEQLLECPACGTPALVYGSVQIEYDEDWDHHERVLLGVHPYFDFVPQALRCAACGLKLEGWDELEAAGISAPWTLENVDLRDFFDEDNY
jgi:hypothetical protein